MQYNLTLINKRINKTELVIKMNTPNLFAPCGTYCGVCVWRVAYITKDEKLKAKLCKMVPGMKPEQIVCDGCRSDTPLYLCEMCKMKKCVSKKEDVESCAECDEFPCKIIERYPFKEFIVRVRWDAEYRKKHGKEKWLEKTIEMNTCPDCKTLCHWKASVCKSCGKELEERYI